MTNVAVWYIPETDELWGVADTRVSGDSRLLTDQAPKILALEVSGRQIKTGPEDWPIMEQAAYGFCYAGSSMAGTMTWVALSTFLQKIGHPEGRTPSLRNISRLAGHLAEKYMSQIGGHLELMVYGYSKESQKYQAFKSDHRAEGGKCVTNISEFDVMDGDVGLLGTKTEDLDNEIAEIRKHVGTTRSALSPRFAIEARIDSGSVSGVGGTLQFGIANKDHFQVFASVHAPGGSGPMQYLGFKLVDDIEHILNEGQVVRMTGLL